MSDGYGQFCAVARALDVLGERWTLLVVREFLLGATTYTDVRRGIPRVPDATLTKRLGTLVRHAVLERTEDGYRLTPAGTALAPVLAELATWASGPGNVPLRDDQLDVALLTLELQRRVDIDALPDHRVTIAIELTDRPAADRHFWLRLDRPRVDLCTSDEGDPVDVWLTAQTRPVVEWWLGETEWAGLVRHPATSITGTQSLVRAVPDWFLRYALRS